GPVDVVLDTDTYNEVDDQFALSYLLASQDQLRVKALYAAPFFNENSTGPADGMEKSYQEILKLLGLAGCQELRDVVFRGSASYLPDEGTPVPSPAAEDLARRAMGYSPEAPLYVVAIGALTNIARTAAGARHRPAHHFAWLGQRSIGRTTRSSTPSCTAADRGLRQRAAAGSALPGGGVRLPGQRAGAAPVPPGQKPPVRLPGGAGGGIPAPLERGPLLDAAHLGRHRRGLAAGGALYAG
ncbi:MAG: hypothetical protein ACLULM_09380, partial [Acutalibacter sp.]